MVKAKDRFIAAATAVIFLFTMVVYLLQPTIIYAEDANAWDGSIDTGFAGGDGSQIVPYRIAEGSQLAFLAQQVNSGVDYENTYFTLANDINLGSMDWTCIGTYDNPFNGNFDGKGYTISNLKSSAQTNDDLAGLFGYNSGTISNVNLNNVDVKNQYNGAAAVCAVNDSVGTIEGCAVQNGIIESRTAAGICSQNSGTINRCYNMASVKTDTAGAGIVYSNSIDGTVSNCYNAGELSGTVNEYESLGGICSYNYGTIEYCLNYGKIENAKTMGGICAQNYYGQSSNTGEDSIIRYCYSDKDVCGADAIGYNGGGKQSNVETKTTAELCSYDFLSDVGFGSVWNEGDIDTSGNNSRLVTRTYTYPSLENVGTEYSTAVKQYNFGTEDTPDWQNVCVINNADELAAINDNLSGNYVLGNDIDLGGAEWTPIGSESSPFTGKFSGNGHTIKNLKLIVKQYDTSAGLFGYNSGTIRNVYLDSVDVCAKFTMAKAAALCGENRAGAIIEECAVLGGNVYLVNGGNGCAGICVYNSGTINKCYNMAAVNVSDKAGAGIIYENSGNGVVSNCYNAGEVTGEAIGDTIYGSNVSGICYNNQSGTIKYCLNFGKVADADIIGGICTLNAGTIESCYTDSDVCSAEAVSENYDTLTNVETKTTAELCDLTFLTYSNFGREWNDGDVVTVGDNGKLVTKTYTYPSLENVGTAYSADNGQYNFGTEDTPDWQTYTLISTADELAAINNNLSGNYVLANDIDLDGVAWTPIGSESSPFTGKFGGDGHTIKNLKSTGSSDVFASLFQYNSGIIRDVYLADVDIYTNRVVAAGLCAVNNASGTIEDCAVLSGNVEASNSYGGAGGVAGICSHNSGKISRCYNMATIKTDTDGAGIVNANLDGGTVSDCYNAGEVSAIGNLGTIGGIGSTNYGTIEYCLNFGKLKNAQYVGGICAFNNLDAIIKSCYTDSICSSIAVDYNAGGTTSSVETKTTAELCGPTFLTDAGFGNEWNAGNESTAADSENAKMRTAEYTYPSLKGIGEAYSVENGQYNFGTENTPDWQTYTLISTADELATINDNLSGNYVLGNDIDLGGSKWTPIGSTSGAFTGKFSGDGYTVSGVNVSVSGYEPAGLFGYSTGVIMNLAVKGDISGASAVGGICGANSAADGNGIISNCSFVGTVTGTGTDVGGICGYNFTNAKISNCFSAADVKGDSEVGGICGYNETNAKVEYSLSTGTVSGNTLTAGVCGKNDGNLEDNLFDEDVSGITVGAKDASDNEIQNGAESVKTEDLCSGNLPSALSSTVWNPGEKSAAADSENARMRTVGYKYPSLKGVGEAYFFDGTKQYNFSIDGTDDWQNFTEISTVEDLKKINDDLDGNYVLMNDIDLKNEHYDFLIGELSGKFSGNGYTISGVNISSDNAYGYTGLFMGNRGTIMYLAVKGNVTAPNAGGICGWNGANAGVGTFKGIIYACSFEGSVKGKLIVGGICGTNQQNGKISSCYAIADVIGTTGYAMVGGIAGRTGYDYAVVGNNTLIENCYFAGTITSGADCGGAIYGSSDASNAYQAVQNCYYNSDLCDKGNDGYVTGLATEAFCSISPSGAFESGEFGVSVNPDNDRMRTVSYKYPRLIIGCAAYELSDVEQYNFSIDGTDDWQEYTKITSAADLKKIKDNLSGNYVLANDIDLGGQTISPIGNQADPFTGKFSGGGHTISNIKIDGADDDSVGLFGKNEGLIMNLAVKGDITGGDNVGGICGMNSGKMYACSFEGSVAGKTYVGGICGYSHGTVNNCYAIGSVEATVNYAGGISGATNSDYAKIENCYFSGVVTSARYKGAISADLINHTITNCYYNSNLSNDSFGTHLTTEELCGNLPSGFSTEVWESGSLNITADPENSRMRTISGKYPRLKEGCAAYEIESLKQYNFSTDGGKDWQAYNEIKTADDFVAIGNDESMWNSNFVLLNDIDLKGKTVTRIGTFEISKEFNGKFSGDGHTISNVSLIGSKTSDIVTGLFGSNCGTIMNLAVTGNIQGNFDSVGGICGKNYGIIYGCSFEGSVKNDSDCMEAGGICGVNDGNISNCFVIATIEATYYWNNDYQGFPGGIAGMNKKTISNCYFVGTTTSNEQGIHGAICNSFVGYGTVTNCYYNSDIYTEADSKATGLTTIEMTADGGTDHSSALAKMGFDTSIWTKNSNVRVSEDSGKAYYPSLAGSSHIPYVGTSAEIIFERADNDPVAYNGDLNVKYGVKLVFENGVEETLDITQCEFKVKENGGLGNTLQGTCDNGVFSDTLGIHNTGDVTYTLSCVPKAEIVDFMTELTKDLVIAVDKMTFDSADYFIFTAPTDLTFDGTAKNASVTIDPTYNIRGYGDITVKYFDSNGNEAEPINAGDYTVKIDISEGDNCNAAENITADSWKFTIAKASAPILPDKNVYFSWAAFGEKIVAAEGIPNNMGDAIMKSAVIGRNDIALISASFSDGKLYFILAQNTEESIGKTAEVTFTLETQNYEDVTYKVIVELNAKSDQTAPNASDADLVFVSTESGITANITTTLTGVEYSFDGINWSNINTKIIDCEEGVSAYVRFAETELLNPSPALTILKTAGHAALIHYDMNESVCTNEDINEYWGCPLCGKFFSDANGTVEIHLNAQHTVDPSAVWESDNDGNHYHICTVCNKRADVGAHKFDSGIVTIEPTEKTEGEWKFTCNICGFVKTATVPVIVNPIDTTPVISGGTVNFSEKLKIDAKTDGKTLTLSWNEIDGASKYTVYEYVNGRYVKLLSTNETSVTLKDLTKKTHKYIVKYTLNGRTSPSGFAGRFTINMNGKPIPRASATRNSVRLTWDAVPNAEKYAVYKYVDGKAVKLIETNKLSVRINGLKENTKYQYIVRAYVDGKWTDVKKTDIVTVTTKK